MGTVKKYLIIFGIGLVAGACIASWICGLDTPKNEPGAGTTPPPVGVPNDALVSIVGKPTVIIKEVVREVATSPQLCADWQDVDGRFFFHQDIRKMDIEQHYMLDFTGSVLAHGKLQVSADLVELSPRTGAELNRIPFSGKSFTLWTPDPSQAPKWTVSGGILAGTDGWSPTVAITRHFPWHIEATVVATDETAFVIVGLSYSF